MDLEAPADAWYVWVGVALASSAFAGIVLGLPATPPPDAAAAANAIDRVAASEYNASATYDHDARAYRLTDEQLALRGEGGVARATLTYGPVVPAEEDPRLRRLLAGADPPVVFGSGPHGRTALRSAVAAARRSTTDDWDGANETVRVRTLVWGDGRVVLVDV